MVETTSRRQLLGGVEHNRELRQEQSQQVGLTHRVHAGWRRRTRVTPVDAVTIGPERHRLAVEVPENGAERLQPGAAENDVVVVEGEDIEVDVEPFVADGDRQRATDASARNAIAVRDATEWPGRDL